MEVVKIKKTKTTKNIFSEKLRVAAYVRVSTKLEMQVYSYESQIKYYTDLISRNVNWSLVGVYSDYGISGYSLSKRSEFLRMLDDAYNGKIDLIITKSVSRFSRNTLDAIDIIRELKKRNIGIYFEEEKINSLYLDNEFLLNIFCSVAQQEFVNNSNHIKLGKKMQMEKGELTTYQKIFGYNVIRKKDKNMYKINKKEAITIKEIYNLYLEGNSTIKIAKQLIEQKIKLNGKATKWSKDYVYSILTNEFYIGKLIQGKRYTVIENGKKILKRNKGEKDMYILNNHHEAIIDIDTFEKVQIKLKTKTKKSNDFNEKKEKSIFVCGFCGNGLAKMNSTNVSGLRYGCYKKTHYDCKVSAIIKKDLLEECFMLCIKLFSNTDYRNTVINDLEKIKSNINNLKKKKDALITFNSTIINKYINKEINLYDFKIKSNEIEKEINLINSSIEKFKNELSYSSSVNSSIEAIFNAIDKKQIDLSKFDECLFNELISFVIVGGHDESGNHKTPYTIRFIYSNKNQLLNDLKETVLNNPLSKDSFIKLLDFNSEINIRYFDKNHTMKIKKGNRVIFEIER